MYKILTLALFLTVATNAQAILIDNGTYTTDTATNLDWADLSATLNNSYNSVSSVFDTYQGGGWRYATNRDVETIFTALFDGFYANSPEGLSYSKFYGSTYSAQDADVSNFAELFGVVTYPNSSAYLSLGMYLDEDALLKMVGVYNDKLGLTVIYGTEETYDRSQYLTKANAYVGTFIVRDGFIAIEPEVQIFTKIPTEVKVPEPSALILLSLGLLSLGIVKRRSIA